MKLKVLVDNNTYIDQYYCGEPAVSYYIEDEEYKWHAYRFECYVDTWSGIPGENNQIELELSEY